MRGRLSKGPLGKRLGSGGDGRAIELLDDALHVGAGLAIGRDAAVLDDRDLARIVGREDPRKIVTEYVDHRAQVLDAGFDVRARGEGMVDTKALGGPGRQLHPAPWSPS